MLDGWRSCRLFTLKAVSMQWYMRSLLGGVLVLGAAASVRLPLHSQAALTLTVEDSNGAALSGATVEDASGHWLGSTDAKGRLTIQCSAPCRLRVAAAGFSEKRLQLGSETTIRLEKR